MSCFLPEIMEIMFRPSKPKRLHGLLFAYFSPCLDLEQGVNMCFLASLNFNGQRCSPRCSTNGSVFKVW